MKYIVGLDQGGTKTVAALADRTGRILAAGYAGGSCHSVSGMEHSMARALEAIREALARADVGIEDVACLHAGMTGADFPYEYELLREALVVATGIADVTVENDCIIAYRGGTSSPSGAVLCIGTGTNAAVVKAGSKPFVFGYHVNDEDSGGESLGNLALRAALNSDVGLSPPTLLKPLILAHYGLPDADTLMERWIGGKLGSKKHLAPVAFEAAEQGDAVARELIRAFGIRNAKYVEAGLNRFAVATDEAVIVLSGSLFKAKSPILLDAVVGKLRESHPGAAIVNAAYEPVVGSVLLALDRLHGTPYPFDGPPLAESVERLGLFRI